VTEAVAYGGWTFNRDNVTEDDLVSQVDDDMMMYFTQNGTVYVGVGHCHVAESLYRSNPVVFLREKCLDVVVKFEDAGIIEGLEVVNRREIRGVGT